MRARLPLILSAIALFVALGGTVYAAGKINGRSIRKSSFPATG
jgi:VIT1/CCC1 family predicted Fe2+/Mn2+ transporter